MKTLIFGLFISISTLGFSQLTGELTEYNRKIEKNIDYKMISSKVGVCVYDISVDPKGKVTSVTLVKDKSTVASTPALMKAKNAILTMKFEGCTYCPKYHHGLVTISFEKK
jgi:hypothetical protein